MFSLKVGMTLIVLGVLLNSLLPGKNAIIWFIPLVLLFLELIGTARISAGFILMVIFILALGFALTVYIESKVRLLVINWQASGEIAAEILGMGASFILVSVVFGAVFGPPVWLVLVGVRAGRDMSTKMRFSFWAAALGSVRFLTAFGISVIVLGKVLAL